MDPRFLCPKELQPEECSLSLNCWCQRCSQPLTLESFFQKVDFAIDYRTFDSSILISNLDKQNDIINQGCRVIRTKTMIPTEMVDATSDFMLVNLNLPLDYNQTLRATSKLYDIMSGQSYVDHPLCEDCTDSLLDQMNHYLKTGEDECKEYEDFLENIKVDSNEENFHKLAKELKDLQEIEDQLQKEFSAIQEKEQETKQLLKSVEEEYETLQKRDDKQWKQFCRIQRKLLNSEDDHHSINNQLLYAQAQLNRLSQTNTLSATFHIWHSGDIGTINVFRLGRLPNVPVEWPEINAAWGQTVLLLHSLAKKMNFTFDKYRLVPYGNHSYIESLESKSKDLPLYCLGGLKFMLDQKFDLAMVAFLDCLIQFKNHVEEMDSTFHLPYRMEKGKVEDSLCKFYSVKTQFNSEQQWTKALKCMLTNLNWALTWVSSQFQ